METTIETYFRILSKTMPSFLIPYLEIPCMQRLKGIGLFCGTDWTNLYHHKCFYSRYHHSVGVALIIWHFTQDKTQTLAGLLHDVSSPVFSHVIDFKNKDYLQQVSTESLNTKMLKEDTKLLELLKKEQISFDAISNYHDYPIADNEVPGLSADRLEYMFSTGLIMADIFDLESIARCYQNIEVLTNENNSIELGFTSEEIAVEYCKKCCQVGILFITNKNKLVLQLLATIIERAITIQLIQEKDVYTRSEQEIMDIFESSNDVILQRYVQTFIKSNNIMEGTTAPKESFSICLDVKKRYINPLCKNKRITSMNQEAKRAVQALVQYQTPKYGYVLLK